MRSRSTPGPHDLIVSRRLATLRENGRPRGRSCLLIAGSSIRQISAIATLFGQNPPGSDEGIDNTNND